MKHIFSVAGTNIRFMVESENEILMGSEKKACRLKLATNLPQEFVPLHAVLLRSTSGNILISGTSGSGKSSLARELVNKGFKTVANDFVLCWISGNKILAGDLNYLNVNHSKKAIEVNRLVCLAPLDKRDRFIANLKEFKSLYEESLKELDSKKLQKFTKKPVFGMLYKIHFCVGNRQNIERTTNSLIQVLENNYTCRKVGVVGLGTIGQAFCNLVIGENWLSELHLFTKTYKKLLGLKMDLQSSGYNVEVKLHKSLRRLIPSVDVLVLCFNIKNEKISNFDNERVRKLFPHTLFIREIARHLRETSFNGRVLVITNPVDILSWALYMFSNLSPSGRPDWKGLFSDQVFGIGLGLDYQRLKALTSRMYVDLEVLGEHGDSQFLAKRNGKHLKFYKNKEILSQVGNYSRNIRKYVERTVFGPSHEIIRVLRVMVYGKGLLRVATGVNIGVFVGNIVNFKGGLLANKYLYDKMILESFDIYFRRVLRLKKLVLKDLVQKSQVSKGFNF